MDVATLKTLSFRVWQRRDTAAPLLCTWTEPTDTKHELALSSGCRLEIWLNLLQPHNLKAE